MSEDLTKLDLAEVVARRRTWAFLAEQHAKSVRSWLAFLEEAVAECQACEDELERRQERLPIHEGNALE